MRRLLLAWAITALFLTSTMSVAVSVQASRPLTIVVAPSGGDDTNNIKAAFDLAIASGPGSIVQLTAGKFYCNNIVVEDFHGIFRGAGMSLTVIDTLRGLDPGLPGLDSFQSDWGLFPVFFQFDGGDIRVSDLTFEITAYEPAEYGWDDGYHVYNVVGVTLWIMGDANSRIERTGFIGHDGSFDWWGMARPTNVISGVWILDSSLLEPMSGSHIISDCYFNRINECVDLDYLMNCDVELRKNICNDVLRAFELVDLYNSKVEISHNRANVIWMLSFISQGLEINERPPFPEDSYSNCLIHNNIIYTDCDGIDVYDAPVVNGQDRSINIIIYENKFYLSGLHDSWLPTGIYGIARDVDILDNYFEGTSLAGIWIHYGISWRIVGNDFNRLDVDASWGHVLLDFWTWNCLVIANKQTIIIDWGINNIVKGGQK